MNGIPESAWQYIAIAAIGILTSIIGWIAHNTREDLKSLRDDHTKLNNLVLSGFHNKDDVNAIISAVKDEFKEVKKEVMESIKDLHKRFDTILTHIKG